MGQIIKNNKNIIILFGVIISILLLNSCVSYPKIIYSVLDISGKRLTVVTKDETSYDMLINNSSVLYIEFSQVGNRFYSQISIAMHTLNQHQRLNIHKLEFEFEGKQKIINLNNNIRLYQEPVLFTVSENNNLQVESFFSYSFRDHNTIRLYFQDIFNKRKENIGENFDLNVKISYSLDNGNTLMQEIKYLVTICEGRPDRPEWMYYLFPGI